MNAPHFVTQLRFKFLEAKFPAYEDVGPSSWWKSQLFQIMPMFWSMTQVPTGDGFLIGLQRMSRISQADALEKKGVVFLMHGLLVVSGIIFIPVL